MAPVIGAYPAHFGLTMWYCGSAPPPRGVSSDGPGGPRRHEEGSTPHKDTGFFWRPHGIGFLMGTTTTRVLANHDGTNDDAGPGGPRHEGGSHLTTIQVSSGNLTASVSSLKPQHFGFRCLEGNVLEFLFYLEGVIGCFGFFWSVWKTILLMVGVERLEFLFCLEGVSLCHWLFWFLLDSHAAGIGS